MQAEVLWLMHAKHRWLAGDPVGARAIMSEVRGLHLICAARACLTTHVQESSAFIVLKSNTGNCCQAVCAAGL